MDDELIIDGQGGQRIQTPSADTAVANDLIDESRSASVAAPVKQTAKQRLKAENEAYIMGASGRIIEMLTSPEFMSDNGMYNTEQIEARRNIAISKGNGLGSDIVYSPDQRSAIPSVTNVPYAQDFTSDPLTIIKDTATMFAMNLALTDDRAMMALGGWVSKLTGNEIGTDLRDRAYEAIRAKTSQISQVPTNAADVETLTHQITQAALSVGEMAVMGMVTGGVAPLVQMGTDSLGGGMFNNMQTYAAENDGSIDGFDVSWGQLFADAVNAAVQVASERYLGFGSARWLRGTTGHAVKEAAEGFLQESFQEFAEDVTEVVKGNEEVSILAERWKDYLTAGVIGGVMQGAMGGALYKMNRVKADNMAAQIYTAARKHNDPNYDENDPKNQQRARAVAKAVNDKAEQDVGVNAIDELLLRADTNNDHGKVRDHIVDELTKAEVARRGLNSAKELTAENLADIQDAATIMAAESVRLAWAQRIPILETAPARMYADGNRLRVRDFKDSERGVAVRSTEDVEAARAKIAEEETRMNELIGRKKMSGRTQAERVQAIRERKTQTTAKAPGVMKSKPNSLDNIQARQKELRDQYAKISTSGTEQEVAAWRGLPEIDSMYALETPYKTYYVALDKKGNLVNVTKYNNQDVISQDMSTDIQTLRKAKGASVYSVSVDKFVESANKLYKQDFGTIEQQESLKNIGRGQATDTGRGSYNARYQEIILDKDADISTILHESAHMWLNTYFKAARNPNAPKEFKEWWGKVERALGIRPNDVFLDKSISEKFARSFEKFIMDGGKGATETMRPAYERLSKKLADIYDDLATKYFDMVGELKPEVQGWFAQNEKFADSLAGEVPQDRQKERDDAMKAAEREEKLAADNTKQAEALSDFVEETQPAPLQIDSDEPMASPYTKEGKKERAQSKKIRNAASERGILVDARSEYNPYESSRAAQDAKTAVQMDWERSKAIALGRIPPQGGISAETMFIAVRNTALMNNDAATLKLLQLSPIQARITEAAQRLSMLRNYTGNGQENIVKMLNDIQNIYNKRLTEKDKKAIEKEVNRLNDIIERFDMDKETAWNNILKDMECK